MRELNIRLGSAFILVFDLGKEETLNSLICLHREIIKIKGELFKIIDTQEKNLKKDPLS
jgi:hypothetical protein